MLFLLNLSNFRCDSSGTGMRRIFAFDTIAIVANIANGHAPNAPYPAPLGRNLICLLIQLINAKLRIDFLICATPPPSSSFFSWQQLPICTSAFIGCQFAFTISRIRACNYAWEANEDATLLRSLIVDIVVVAPIVIVAVVAVVIIIVIASCDSHCIATETTCSLSPACCECVYWFDAPKFIVVVIPCNWVRC